MVRTPRSRTPWQPRTRWGPADPTLTEAQVADQIAHLEQQKAEVDAALAELNVLRAQLLAAKAADRRSRCR